MAYFNASWGSAPARAVGSLQVRQNRMSQISAGFCLFVSTDEWREASFYGVMTLSQRPQESLKEAVTGSQWPVGGGTNKANFSTAIVALDCSPGRQLCGLGTDPQRNARHAICFPEPGRASCTNKPNLLTDAPAGPAWGQACETKPIARQRQCEGSGKYFSNKKLWCAL